ncbi:hypothetical protein AAHA92_26047 [Salvia divinorum]|uniref:Uncharacterized protein n=1 Tax=Salvia divinorum TaxID=28513 RepID=A0ABD1GCM1_SALDI
MKLNRIELYVNVMCGSLIYNLVPHSLALIQPGREEEVDAIIVEMEQYIRENEVRWFRFFMACSFSEAIIVKSLIQPGREEEVGVMIAKMEHHIREHEVLMQSVYVMYGFRLWPNGGIEFRLFQMLRCAYVIFSFWLIWRNLPIQSVYMIHGFRSWPQKGIAFRLFHMLQCALLILAIWARITGWRSARRLNLRQKAE